MEYIFILWDESLSGHSAVGSALALGARSREFESRCPDFPFQGGYFDRFFDHCSRDIWCGPAGGRRKRFPARLKTEYLFRDEIPPSAETVADYDARICKTSSGMEFYVRKLSGLMGGRTRLTRDIADFIVKSPE